MAKQTERKFKKAGDMIHIMKSIHKLNLFMNSKLTPAQRILSRFQTSSVIYSSDQTESSDNLEDFYDDRAEPQIKKILNQLTEL